MKHVVLESKIVEISKEHAPISPLKLTIEAFETPVGCSAMWFTLMATSVKDLTVG
jgi:hypothetical protein